MAPYEYKRKNSEFSYSGSRPPSTSTSSSKFRAPSSPSDDWKPTETPKYSSHRGNSKAVAAAAALEDDCHIRSDHEGNKGDTNPGDWSSIEIPKYSSRRGNPKSVMMAAAAASPDDDCNIQNGHDGNKNDTNLGDWSSIKIPQYSSHRGNSKTIPVAASPDDDNSIQSGRDEDSNDTERKERTSLKDIFSCARPKTDANNDGGADGELQTLKNVEIFLDQLVNGFWQCPGFDHGTSSTVSTSTGKSQQQSCNDALGTWVDSTQLMEFKFVRTSADGNIAEQRSREGGKAQTSPSFSEAQQPKRATGKMFKRIRVKRGENIGLELFEHSKNVYISRVAKEGIGLKRGMRIIAINDHPCPDSVGEAIELLAKRTPNENGFVTFVTAEDHDFEAAASVVSCGDDSYSIQSSMGFV